MKKLFIAFIAIAAGICVGCSSKAGEETAAPAPLDALQECLETNDIEGLRAALTDMQATIRGLMQDGYIDSARVYIEDMKAFVSEHGDDLHALVGKDASLQPIINAIESLPANFGEMFDEMKERLEAAKQEVSGDVGAATDADEEE